MFVIDFLGRITPAEGEDDLRIDTLLPINMLGETYLVGHSFDGAIATVFQVDANGSLVLVTDPDPSLTDIARLSFDMGSTVCTVDITAAQLFLEDAPVAIASDTSLFLTQSPSQQDFAYVGGFGTDGLYAFSVNGTQTTPLTGQNVYHGTYLSNVSTIKQIATENGVLIVTASLSGGVTILEQDGAGRLTTLSEIGIENGLPMNDLTQMDIVVSGGETFVLVASETGTLSSVRVDSEGNLSIADIAFDTADVRLDTPAFLETVYVGEQAFVVVGGGDGGLSVLSILPTGQFLEVATFDDTQLAQLGNLTSIVVQVEDDGLHLYLGSEQAEGLAHLLVEITPSAAPLFAADDSRVRGSAANDILVSDGENTTLEGRDGDDILIDGSGNDTLRGGNGHDVFVFGKDGRVDLVRDFEIGRDRLDLSAWGMLYSLDQITFEVLSNGIRLTFGDEILVVRSMNGDPLTQLDLEGALITDLHRPVVNPIDPDAPQSTPVFEGGEGGDWFEASLPNSTFIGGVEFDFVDYSALSEVTISLEDPSQNTGGALGDTYLSIEGVIGTDGNDWIEGDEMSNLLIGGNGDDTLMGGAAYDQLEGGAGNDMLFDSMGGGNLIGGAGDDIIWNTSGSGTLVDDGQVTSTLSSDDLLLGGYANDTLKGGAGNDVLIGDFAAVIYSGDDQLEGGKGDDFLQGGDGEDVFVFRPLDGNDTIASFSLEAVLDGAPLSPNGADFDPRTDTIKLIGFSDITSGADALAYVQTNAFGFAEFSHEGTSIVFWGVEVTELSASIFWI